MSELEWVKYLRSQEFNERSLNKEILRRLDGFEQKLNAEKKSVRWH